MKITEIVVYPDRDENIEKYTQYFQHSQYTPAFGKLMFSEVIDLDNHYLGLFDQNKLVAILHLSTRDHKFWQITYAQVDMNFRGQGCFRYLLTNAVTTHDSVLSDSHQTPQSKNAWQSLIQYPGPNLDIFAYDVDTENKIPIYNIPHSQVWNNKDTPILLISKSDSNVRNSRKAVMTNLKENIGIDRSEINIWYGPNSSTSDYTNP